MTRVLVLGAAAMVAASATAVPAASALGAKKSKSATVVDVVDRAPYGPMLATVGGLSLYTSPSPCTGGCLTIWPPLAMPKGKTVPLGTAGLGTVTRKVGHKKELQVTFDGRALYRFDTDSGSSVMGENVGGFTVATVG